MIVIYLVEYDSDPDEGYKIIKEIGRFNNQAEIRQALWRLPKYHTFDRKCYLIKPDLKENENSIK